MEFVTWVTQRNPPRAEVYTTPLKERRERYRQVAISGRLALCLLSRSRIVCRHGREWTRPIPSCRRTFHIRSMTLRGIVYVRIPDAGGQPLRSGSAWAE